MKLIHHIKFAKHAIEASGVLESGVYRLAYLFGSIAPDFNCVYPPHGIDTTKKRYISRIQRVQHTRSKLIRCFTIGVITHYTCDYFTLAHNNSSVGLFHKMYETGLLHTYMEEGEEIQYRNVGIKSSSAFGIYEEIFEANQKYLEELGGYLKGEKWYLDKQLMEHDLSYALPMCESVVSELLRVRVHSFDFGVAGYHKSAV